MPWTTLDIEPTRDPRVVRQAYARALKSRAHEANPRYFEELRGAYERALAICADARGNDAEPSLQPAQASPPDSPTAPASTPDADAAAAGGGFGYEPVGPEAFDALNQALGRLAESVRSGSDEDMASAWNALSRHPLLDRLDIRERASEIIADMVATHWPRSTPVWTLAEKHFAWEPPTQSDRSLLAGPLRWLYDRRQSENARWDRLWQTYDKVEPHPDELLAWRGPGWQKALRFLAHRNARCVMRRFLADVSALGLDDQFGDRTAALQWWKAAFARPLPTRRHAVPVILSLAGIPVAGSDPFFWRAIALVLGVVAAWYAVSVTWNHFKVGRQLNALLDGPRLLFGPPIVATAGIVACGLAKPMDRMWLSMVGVTVTAVSAMWAWLRAAERSPFQYMNDTRLLNFVVYYLFLSIILSWTIELPQSSQYSAAIRWTFGLAVAHWVMYTGGQSLGALEARFSRLTAIRVEPWIIAVALVFLAAEFAVASANRAFVPVIEALGVVWIIVSWSFATWRSWSIDWTHLAVLPVGWFGMAFAYQGLEIGAVPSMAGPILCVVVYGAIRQLCKK